MCPKPGGGKRQALLANAAVRRWFENTARGALTTADNYLRILGLFLENVGKSPEEFAAMEPQERDDILADYIEDMLRKGKAGSYAAVVKKAVVSWLDWNGKKLSRRIKVPGAHKRPTLANAHIPLQEEFRKVLTVADVRAKTVIGLIAFSGLREGVLGTYKGDGGLRLEAFEELSIEENTVSFAAVPARINVPEALSKTGRPYFTFLGAEGCDYLLAYLTQRMEKGEKLSPESPVITPKYDPKPFIRTLNIAKIVRKPMRSAGLKEPPYIWRSYFASRTMLAESKGLLRDYREFFMGHSGDIEHVYALHKMVPPDTVEAMRDAYEKALEYLETTPRMPREDLTRRFLRAFLQAKGYSKEEIEDLELESMSEDEIADILEKVPETRNNNNGNNRQRIVKIEELPAFLENGWVFKSSLPDGSVVIESCLPI